MVDNTVSTPHHRLQRLARPLLRSHLLSLLLLLTLLTGCLAPSGNSGAGIPQSGMGLFQNVSPDCAGIQPGQLCLLGGSISLDTLDKENQPLSKTGERVNLADLRAIHLGADSTGGSAALLKIKAKLPSQTPDSLVTLLAFGDVSLVNQAASDPDQRAFTSLTFHSEGAHSGLLVISPGGGKYASLLINGAFLTLGSSALLQTQAGQMTVATLEGAVTVDADLASQPAPAGSQVNVPLDESGFAAGEPGTASTDSILVQNVNQAVSEYLKGSRRTDAADPKVQAVSSAIEAYLRENSGAPESSGTDPKVQAVNDAVTRYLEELKHKPSSGQAESAPPSVYTSGVSDFDRLEIAIQGIEMVDQLSKQCSVHKNPKQVYRMLKWSEYIQTFEQDGINIGPEKMKKINDQVAGCVHFELVFDSTVNTQNGEVGMESHVHAQGIEVKYDPKTGSLSGDSQPLEYQSFTVIEPPDDSCKRTETKQNGTIKVTGGQMQVNGKQVRIEVQIAPEMPSEELVYNCVDGNGNWIASPPIRPGHWQNFFRQLFIDLASGTSGSFKIKDWKYTARTIFAEAIYADRTQTWEDVTVSSNTFLQLVHNPR